MYQNIRPHCRHRLDVERQVKGLMLNHGHQHHRCFSLLLDDGMVMRNVSSCSFSQTEAVLTSDWKPLVYRVEIGDGKWEEVVPTRCHRCCLMNS